MKRYWVEIDRLLEDKGHNTERMLCEMIASKRARAYVRVVRTDDLPTAGGAMKLFVPRNCHDDGMVEWQEVQHYNHLKDLKKYVLASDADALERVSDARKSALEFAKGAIGDAIYLDDGLDGATGEAVLKIIVEAIEHGTFDQVEANKLDTMTFSERAMQGRIDALERALREIDELSQEEFRQDVATGGVVGVDREGDKMEKEKVDAFAEGVEAAHSGRMAAHCPYKYDSPEGQQWIAGFESAGGEE